jgi:hypothetical protein
MDQDPKLFPGQQDLLLAQKLSVAGVLMNLGMGKLQLDDLAQSRQLTQGIMLNARPPVLSWPGTSPRANDFRPARNFTGWRRVAKMGVPAAVPS